MIAQSLKLLFNCYVLMLFLRVLGSWVPKFRDHSFMRFIAHYTDPYLNIFRKIIPPIGGTIDISPMIAFFCLRILERIVLSFFR